MLQPSINKPLENKIYPFMYTVVKWLQLADNHLAHVYGEHKKYIYIYTHLQRTISGNQVCAHNQPVARMKYKMHRY